MALCQAYSYLILPTFPTIMALSGQFLCEMWAEVKTFMAGKHYCKNIDSVLRLRRSLPTAVTSFFQDLLVYAWINTTPWGQCSELSNLVNASLNLSADFSLAWGMHITMVQVMLFQWYWIHSNDISKIKGLRKVILSKSVTEGGHMLSDKYQVAFFIIINVTFTYWKHQQYCYQ